MPRTLFILPSLLLAVICAAQPVEKLLKEADSLSYEKKYTEALQVYNRAWLIDSSNFRLYIDRGRAFEGVKDLEKAFYDYSKAIQLRPDSAEGYHYRAIILYSMMYTEESIMDNTLALERASNDTIRMMSFMNRGNGKMQKRDFQGAYEDFTRASFYSPNDIGILNNIATVLDELNRVDEAIDYLKRAIKIDSTFIGPYVNLGFQYTKLKRYKEAIEYFNKALLIDKDEPLTLNNRGLARYY